jgi:hypothetical protein
MAQSLVEKRQRLAGTAVSASTALLDAVNGLEVARQEHLQSGNFADTDCDATGIQHLTAYLVGLMLDTVTVELNTFLDGNIGSNPANPTRRAILLQMRR